MIRRAPWLASALVAILLLGASPAARALELDDEIPGLPLPASPVTGALDELGNVRDVYRVSLVAGETLVLSLTTELASGCDLDLFLYGPGTTAGPVNHTIAIASAKQPATGYPERITYAAPVSGEYYVEVFAYDGAGPSHLTWSILPEPLLPVYRFFNRNAGTHFYTPSLDEANTVIARWSNVFDFEGIAYYTKATKNPQPLYRFFNRANGSHFYTGSPAERDAVIARWSNVYTYEGETYRVSPAGEAGKVPVFRFYNSRNGSHFFTASVDEANAVIAKWSNIYAFEGPAFSLGQ